MRCVWCAAAAVPLLLFVMSADAHADTWTLELFKKHLTRSEWDGYGVGTVVHKRKKRTRASEEGEPQVRVSERRITVLEITDTKVKFRWESRDDPDGEWEGFDDEEKLARDRRLEVQDAGKETLVIGDVRYACLVKQLKTLSIESDEVYETFKAWVHPEKGILQLHGGEEGFRLKLTLTDFDEPLVVGERTLSCLAYTVQGGGEGEKAEGKVLVSTEVPGTFVRYELRIARDEGGPSTEVEEVVAFEKK